MAHVLETISQYEGNEREQVTCMGKAYTTTALKALENDRAFPVLECSRTNVLLPAYVDTRVYMRT